MIKVKKRNTLVIRLVTWGSLFIILVGCLYYFFPQPTKTLVSSNTSQNIFKILFSALVGCIVGVERENKNRPAGLRTHALVAVGATIVMIIPFALEGNSDLSLRMDPTRLGAQVISGIGFLGAGTIIRNGTTVKGLTTAASLWVVATIGLAIGAGLYLTSTAAIIIVFIVLKVLGDLEHRHMIKNTDLEIQVIVKNKPGQLGLIGQVLGEYGISIKSIDISETDESLEKDFVTITLFLKIPRMTDQLKLLNDIETLEGVLSVLVNE